MLKLAAVALASALLLAGCGAPQSVAMPQATDAARVSSMKAMFARPPMGLFPF